MIDQDHDDDIDVVIIDDRKVGLNAGTLNIRDKRRIHTIRDSTRAATLLHKYQAGLEFAFTTGRQFDAVFVGDDDDAYLLDHVSQHAKVLENHYWSHPSHVFTYYANQFRVEDTGGRFWASCAYRMSALLESGEYIHKPRNLAEASYDQRFLGDMRAKYGDAGMQASPTYIYGWSIGGENHVSCHIENGVYDFTQVPEVSATRPLFPHYSEETNILMEMAKVFRGAAK